MHACSILRVLARLAVLWAVGVVLAAALLVVLVDTAVVAVDGGPVSVSDLVDTSLPAIRVLALTGMPISGVQPITPCPPDAAPPPSRASPHPRWWVRVPYRW